jgi:pseudouridine-5'-phosphate glycosidase
MSDLPIAAAAPAAEAPAAAAAPAAAPAKTLEERVAALEATSITFPHPLTSIETIASTVKAKLVSDEKAAVADAIALFKGKMTTTAKYGLAVAAGMVGEMLLHHFVLPGLW